MVPPSQQPNCPWSHPTRKLWLPNILRQQSWGDPRQHKCPRLVVDPWAPQHRRHYLKRGEPQGAGRRHRVATGTKVPESPREWVASQIRQNCCCRSPRKPCAHPEEGIRCLPDPNWRRSRTQAETNLKLHRPAQTSCRSHEPDGHSAV